MIRQASFPILAFLVLIQWALVAAGAGLLARWRNPWRLRLYLLELLAPCLLVGAMAAIWLLPTAALEHPRTLLTFCVLPVLFCWGRLALLPLPNTVAGSRRANHIWCWLTATIHLALLALACWWLSAWFLEHKIHAVRGLDRSPALPSLTVFINRLSGAMLMGGALAGTLAAWRFDAEGESPAARRVAIRLGRWLWMLVIWRAVAIGLTILVAAAADPAWAGQFLNSMFRSGGRIVVLRVLIGLILPAAYGLLAQWKAEDGKPLQALQDFPPALLMIIIGEALAAAMTVGMLGLGF